MTTCAPARACRSWRCRSPWQLIAGGAIATRDYFPGHHDKDAARELGSPHVFMNILTTNGLAQRYVEDWAGPRRASCRI